MAILLAALLLVAESLPYATAQAKFIGIDDDPQVGQADAKVTIIEFGDYQCPNCRAFWRETLPRIKKEYVDTGKVRIVYRDFPIAEIHPEAMVTTMAAEGAEDLGKFWQFHDRVFREQDRRGRNVVRFTAADLKRWGAEVGMNGTPVFFINGRVLAGAHPFSTFQKVIEEELRK